MRRLPPPTAVAVELRMRMVAAIREGGLPGPRRSTGASHSAGEGGGGGGREEPCTEAEEEEERRMRGEHGQPGGIPT